MLGLCRSTAGAGVWRHFHPLPSLEKPPVDKAVFLSLHCLGARVKTSRSHVGGFRPESAVLPHSLTCQSLCGTTLGHCSFVGTSQFSQM